MRPRRARGAIVACAALVGGCADLHRATRLTDFTVDPSSPISGTVEAAAERRYPVASFRSVPPVNPVAIPPAEVRTQVVQHVAGKRGLTKWRVDHPAYFTDTPAFYVTSRAKLPARETTPVAANATAVAEAYAAQQRQVAVAPPRPN